MNQNYKHSYDDMSPDPTVREEDRKFRNMKRIVTIFMLILILAAVSAIVFILVSTDDRTNPAAETDLSSITLDDSKEDVDKVISSELAEDSGLLESAVVDTTDGTGAEDTSKMSSDQTDSAAAVEMHEESSTASENPEKEETLSAAESDESYDARVKEESANGPVSFTSYTVQEGDTLTKIATSFGLQPETIIGVNAIEDIDDIEAGAVLEIPDRDGQMYTVQEGDNLSVIAHRYDMGYVTLAEVNGLSSSLIMVGQRLFIPDKTISKEDFQIVMNTFFSRPADGEISAHFDDLVEDVITGEKKLNSGILIINEAGTPVTASMNGTVTGVYNVQSGLGRYIVLEHENGYTSLYGHLDKLHVQVGDSVEQGDLIGTMGITGRVLEPSLYFEIDKNGEPVDPEQFF